MAAELRQSEWHMWTRNGVQASDQGGRGLRTPAGGGALLWGGLSARLPHTHGHSWRGGACGGTGRLLRRERAAPGPPAGLAPAPRPRAGAPSFLGSLLSRFLKLHTRPCFQESLCTPHPSLPRSLTLPPSPGAPHAAGNPAWAGQRSCSVSSADQWSEASALSPGMQDPRKGQRPAALQHLR